MPPVQCLPGNKHITFWAVRKEVVTLIKDQYCVLYLAMQEVDPEGDTIHGPPWSPLHYAVNIIFCPREGDPIHLGLRRRERGGGIPLSSPCTTPCWNCQWAARDITARYASHLGKRNSWWSLYRCVRPSPVILRPQASTECPPFAQKGWHAILTVFPTLVSSPETDMSKSTCICGRRTPI